MQQQVEKEESKAWEVLKLPGDQRILYHWSCRRVLGKHVTNVRIIKDNGRYSILVSEKVAGARLFRQGWTPETLNSFLVKLGFSPIPQ